MALKILREHMKLLDSSSVDEFEHEIRIMRMLRHRCVSVLVFRLALQLCFSNIPNFSLSTHVTNCRNIGKSNWESVQTSILIFKNINLGPPCSVFLRRRIYSNGIPLPGQKMCEKYFNCLLSSHILLPGHRIHVTRLASVHLAQGASN